MENKFQVRLVEAAIMFLVMFSVSGDSGLAQQITAAHSQLASITQNLNIDFVGQTGGATNAVAVQGNFAYVGEGYELTIINISNPAVPTVVSKTSWFPGIVRGVAVSGNYVYLTAGTGLYIVDVGTASSPKIAGYYSIGASKWVIDVAVVGSYAYFVGDYDSLYIVNISNPASPVLVSSLSVYKARGSKLDVEGGYVYLANGQVSIVNVSDPTAPTLVKTFAGQAYAVDVVGNYAYVADTSSLDIFDITNPASPTYVGGIPSLATATTIAVAGSLAYIGEEDYPNNRGLMEIIDISNPVAPTRVSFLASQSSATDLALSGNRMYLATWGGLLSADISTPSSPTAVGYYRVPYGWNGIAKSGTVLYGVNNSSLEIVDGSDPAAPREIGAYMVPPSSDHPSLAGPLAVSGNYAYAVKSIPQGSSIQVINIADPSAPFLVGTSVYMPDLPGAITVIGNRVYFDTNMYLRILDVSNPAAPVLVGVYARTVKNSISEDYYRSSFVGNFAYVLNGGNLDVVNVADPTNPVKVGYFDAGGWGGIVAASGNRAYISDGRGPYATGTTLDISNPAAPVAIGGFSAYPDSTLESMEVSGNYLYLGTLSGVRVMDVSDPVSPKIVGTYYMPDSVNDLTLGDNYIYVVHDALFILRFSPPSQYSIQGAVTDASGKPVSGVIVTAGPGRSTMTGANGNYTLGGLPAGTYAVTPSLAGYTFSPPSRTVVVPTNFPVNFSRVLAASVSISTSGHFVTAQVQDLLASLPLHVKVSSFVDGTPIAGASIRLTRGDFVIGTTNSNGVLDYDLLVTSDTSDFVTRVVAEANGQSFSTGSVTLYHPEWLAGSPHELTKAEADNYPNALLVHSLLQPGWPCLVSNPLLCTAKQVVSILAKVVESGNSGYNPQEKDIVLAEVYRYNAQNVTPAYLYYESVTRGGSVIYSWTKWTEDAGLLQEFLNQKGLYPDALDVKVASPVTALVIDPSGKRAGYDPVLGNYVFDFPVVISNIGDEPYWLIVPSPVAGQYTIQLTGTGNGPMDSQLAISTIRVIT